MGAACASGCNPKDDKNNVNDEALPLQTFCDEAALSSSKGGEFSEAAASADDRHSGGSLTRIEVAHVERSWEKAKEFGLSEITVTVFQNLFELAPEALKLFPFKDEPNVYESARFKAHGRKLTTMVDIVVSKLRDLDMLLPTLEELAVRHAGYGVLAAHYPILGQALVRSLRVSLPEVFNPEVELAWAKAWNLIADIMVEAAEAHEQEQRDVEGPLTVAQIAAVERTWSSAKALGLEAIGIQLFANIFEAAPEALQLFPFKDESNPLKSTQLRKHAANVTVTVDAAIQKLRDLSKLVPVLQALAVRHVGYGTVAEHYPVVGAALLKVLRSNLGDAFTVSVEVSWKKVWSLIEKTMVEAAEAAQVPAAQGEPNQAGASALAPVPEPPLTQEELATVERTWKAAKGLGMEKVGVLLFTNIFQAAPEALQLFSFKNAEDVYESPQLKAHATKVVQVVDQAISKLRDLPALVPILQELSLKHVGYGVVAQHYPVVGQALLKTLQAGLAAAFVPKVEDAWKKVWSLIEKAMTQAGGAAAPPAAAAAGAAVPKPRAKALLHRAETKLVEQAWAMLKDKDLELLGAVTMSKFLQRAPEALPLFSFKDEQDLVDSPLVKMHAGKVLSALGALVSKIRDVEALQPMLEELAIKHTGYGARPSHYQALGEALIGAIKDLTPDFTPEMEAAFGKFWASVSKKLAAAGAGKPKGLLSVPGPGASALSGSLAASSAESAASSQAASSGGGDEAAVIKLRKSEIKLVEATWEAAKSAGLEAVGVKVFSNIFKLAPEALDLFPFKNERPLEESPKFKAHASKVAGTLDVAVSKLRQTSALCPILAELGLKHVGYRVLPAHYPVVGKAILRTLKHALGEEMTPAAQAAWSKVWSLISNTMINAQNSAR